MSIKPKLEAILSKAALATLLIAANSSAIAEVITYNYSGVIGNPAVGSGLFYGEAIQAEFKIETGIAPVSAAPSTYYPYSVLSATYTFHGLTFESKAYSAFDTSSPNYTGGAGENLVIYNPGPTQNRLFVRIFSNDIEGNILAGGMSLSITDRLPIGPVSGPQIPTSLSGLNLTPGNDIVILQMGYCNLAPGGVCSSFDSINGSLTATTVSAVPEPEIYAMMLGGLGLLGAAARRRKQKAA